jgi:hypothetical protein
MGKISNTKVEFALEKAGQPVSDTSNITQALKYTSPVNGVIKLFLYEREEVSNFTAGDTAEASNSKI